MTLRNWVCVVLCVSTLWRLSLASVWDLGNDETYYALYLENPAWCYFDHPPLVACIGFFGRWLAGIKITWLDRLGFVLIGTLTTHAMASLGRRWGGERGSLVAAILHCTSGYPGLASGTFILPDGPVTLFWVWGIGAVLKALEASARYRDWMWLGVCVAGGIWSKYTALLFPFALLIWWAIDRTERCRFRQIGPWLAAATMGVLILPLVGWNVANGWASFGFQGQRALPDGQIRWEGPILLLVAQAGYLFPWIWIVMMRALANRLRGGLRRDERALMALAVVPLGLILAVSCVRPVLPHWSMLGYISLIPLVARDWATAWVPGSRGVPRRLIAFGALAVLLSGLLLGHARWGWLQSWLGPEGVVDTRWDPTLDAYGWDQVATELDRRGLLRQDGRFLVASKWYHSAHLRRATGSRIDTACFHATDARGFVYWSSPEDWVGRDGVLLCRDASSVEPGIYEKYFERIRPEGTIEVRRAGEVVRRFRVYLMEKMTRPFPFANRARAMVPRVSPDS